MDDGHHALAAVTVCNSIEGAKVVLSNTLVCLLLPFAVN